MPSILKYLTVIVLTLTVQFISGQDFKDRGRIIDSVFIANGRESFSLYVPATFIEQDKYPLILIFDPMARGTTGIKPFILSAETHGYLLACSNNSKNGPYAPNFAIAERMYKKVDSMFNIDKDRVYTAGFSGGSRLASKIAISSGTIKGVIACGAGLPEDGQYQLLTTRFSYAAIIGNKDMNFLELQELRKVLSKMSFPHEVITTDLDHRWPADQDVLLATDWLQLEYLKAHPHKKLDSLVDGSYHRAYAYLQHQKNQGHLVESAEGYNRLVMTFRRHKTLDSIVQGREELLSSGAYKAETRSFASALQEERRMTDEFWDRFNKDMEQPDADLKWWRKQMEKLEAKTSKSDRWYGNMYERLQYKMFAHALETAQFRTLPDAYPQKKFCYDLCILIYPKYFYAYYRQMELALEQGDQSLALACLDQMIRNGYDDRNRLVQSKVGQQLQGNSEFETMLDRMNSSSAKN